MLSCCTESCKAKAAPSVHCPVRFWVARGTVDLNSLLLLLLLPPPPLLLLVVVVLVLLQQQRQQQQRRGQGLRAVARER